MSVKILELSQIFAERSAFADVFEERRKGVTDFYLRLWVSLAVYSCGNIAFNRGTLRRDLVRSLFLILRVSPFAICPRKRKRKRGSRERIFCTRISRAFLPWAAAVLREVAKYSEMRTKAKFSPNVPSNYYYKKANKCCISRCIPLCER